MERNVRIDILKGIGVLAVLMGHCMDLPYAMRHFIFTFHMPLFFIASGFFWKSHSIRKSFVGGIKLIKYYTVAAVVFAIANSYSGALGGGKEIVEAVAFANAVPVDSAYFGYMPPIKVLWFLPALFWCKFIYNGIERYISFEKWELFLFLCISYIACLSVRVVNVPFGIQAGASALVYYSSGVMIKRENKSRNLYVVFVSLWIFSLFLSKYDMGTFTNSFYPIRIAGGIGGTLLFMVVSFLLSKAERLAVILSFTGRFSLYFYILHSLLNPLITIISGYQGLHLYTMNVTICFIVIVSSFFVYRSCVLNNTEKVSS